MSYTLTLKEVNDNLEELNKKVLKLINKTYNISISSPKLDNKLIKGLYKLLIYKDIISNWQQGNFTNEEYTNYLSINGYLQIINKINKINV